MLLEPRAQHRVVVARQFRGGVDDAELLEDHPVADRRVALVELQREPFAIQHFVVEPHAAQRVQLVGVGFVSARVFENLSRVRIDLGVDDDDAWVVAARDKEVVGGEQHAAEDDEMQQRLAQPSGDGCAAGRC